MMDSMAIYKCRDIDSGEIVSQSNVLSMLIDVVNDLAVDERTLHSSEILDPAGEVIYAIKAGANEPYIDLTDEYPEMLPHPFKENQPR